VDRDYEGALENFTAAICLTDSRRINKAKTTSESTTQDVDKDNTKANEAETKVIRFRSLSHRSETYMSLDKFTHAYNDANAALSLYPPNDILDSATPSSGLRPSELALAYDRIARACVGLAKANMGVAARTKSGRVSFIKLSGPGMANTESEMEEEAREHWETALVLAGMLDSDTNAEEDGGEGKKGEDGDKKKKEKSSDTEGARLVERFQRELKKLVEEDEEEEETNKKPTTTTSSGMGDVMDAMKNGAVSGDPAKNMSESKDEDSPSKSAPNPSSKPAKSKNRSTGGLPSKTPSDHPACYVSYICINLLKVCMRCARNAL